MNHSSAQFDEVARHSSHWGILGLGTIALAFGNGVWAFAPLAWIAPILILRFMRGHGIWRACLFGSLACVLAAQVHYMGYALPGPKLVGITMGLLVGLVSFLPFLADRLLSPRLQGFSSVLVFPLATVCLGYPLTVWLGSWGSPAYTQHGQLVLIQLVSLTGIYGLTFLMALFASLVVRFWEQGFAWARIRPALLGYLCLLGLILFFGEMRLTFFAPRAETVRVAAITSTNSIYEGPSSSDGDYREKFREHSAVAAAEVIDETRRAARFGARLVVWQEGCVPLHDDDEEDFLRRAQAVAVEEGIYLAAAVFVVGDRFPNELGENKVLWITPAGEIERAYLKARPVPGIEPCVAGDGRIHVEQTPFGKISAAICYDLDFPSLIQQAGGADVMVAPANDWQAINPLHTRMAAFRAVENGFSVVRATGMGLSAAFDPQGRILASSDYYHTTDAIMIADIPKEGTTTLYNQAGDWFAWLAMLAMAVVVGRTLLSRQAGTSNAR